MKPKKPVAKPVTPSSDEEEGSASEYEADDNGIADESDDDEDPEDVDMEEENLSPTAINGETKITIEHLAEFIKMDLEEAKLPLKKAMKTVDWGKVGSTIGVPQNLFYSTVQSICNQVKTKVSTMVLLKIALEDRAKYCKSLEPKKLRRTTGFNVFITRYKWGTEDVPHTEKFKKAAEEYKLLSESERAVFEKEAVKVSISRGVLNMDGSKKAAVKKKKAEVKSGDLRALFSAATKTPEKSLEKDSDAEDDESEPEAEKEPVTKAKKSAKSTDENAIPVSVVEYFVKERKTQGDYKDEALKKFSALSAKERVTFTYKIMELVTKKFKKTPVLSKGDQEFLDQYENRPTKPTSAWNLFMAEKINTPELADYPVKQRFTMLGAMWKALDPTKKQVFERKLSEKRADYETEHKNYLEGLPDFRREQELIKKPRKSRARRASVGEEGSGSPEDRTNSTFLDEKKLDGGVAAKRKQRSKTVDCSSSLNIRDFFKAKEDAPTPVKKAAAKRKAEEVEEPPKKAEETPVAPPSPKKKAKAAKKAPVDNGTSAKKEEETPVEQPSPKKAKKSKGATAAAVTESPAEKPKPPPKKAQAEKKSPAVPPPVENGNKKATKQKQVPAENGTSPKKAKKAKKTTLPEPVKPPESVKAYFKSKFTGDASDAGKAFKKLSREEKERYYEELKAISDKYLENLKTYMKSLSKEEVALYMARAGH